jgi:hypothetical protein
VGVDGIHAKVTLGGDDRLYFPVTVGARLDGKKKLVALQESYWESTEEKRGEGSCVIGIQPTTFDNT